jgi:hypothetical protein
MSRAVMNSTRGASPLDTPSAYNPKGVVKLVVPRRRAKRWRMRSIADTKHMPVSLSWREKNFSCPFSPFFVFEILSNTLSTVGVGWLPTLRRMTRGRRSRTRTGRRQNTGLWHRDACLGGNCRAQSGGHLVPIRISGSRQTGHIGTNWPGPTIASPVDGD